MPVRVIASGASSCVNEASAACQDRSPSTVPPASKMISATRECENDMKRIVRRHSIRNIAAGTLLAVLLCFAGADADAATWYVTNDNDNGAEKTLRYAVEHAVSGDVIEIRLMGLVLGSQITVTKNLTITEDSSGEFGSPTIRQTGTNMRIFEVASEVTCVMKGLNVVGGNLPLGPGNVGAGVCNRGTLRMESCMIGTNTTRNQNGAGIFSSGALTLSACTVTNNNAVGSLAMGGGVYSPHGSSLRLENGCSITGNFPDDLVRYGSYSSDGTNQIGAAPNRQATAFEGYAGTEEPEPRSIVGDDDVNEVAVALADPESALFAAVVESLASDLGHAPGGKASAPAAMAATLYGANTFENVAVTSGDLAVEYTASWPENARYYALFSRADGTGYEIPERGVRFEIDAGQTLPDGVTPPDFYIPGEGLMTWRSVVTDNGSYDLNPTAGVVTFRACSVRAAEAVGDKGSGGGCDAAGGSEGAPLALLLVLPFVVLARKGCE